MMASTLAKSVSSAAASLSDNPSCAWPIVSDHLAPIELASCGTPLISAATLLLPPSSAPSQTVICGSSSMLPVGSRPHVGRLGVSCPLR